ncbi:CLUMA_CG002939, isoform A [Clunio marinus]|uniref:CLUMA_CG002939, isoform A n=1 Tax=Clunio marinus TaxID=568069 RepID=A0A1J1HNR9_9DIPT|nr:CLUMA_CG002939, isoform A [Clunio marinus]
MGQKTMSKHISRPFVELGKKEINKKFSIFHFVLLPQSFTNFKLRFFEQSRRLTFIVLSLQFLSMFGKQVHGAYCFTIQNEFSKLLAHRIQNRLNLNI